MKWIYSALASMATYAFCAPLAFLQRGHFALGGEFLLAFAVAFITAFALSKAEHGRR